MNETIQTILTRRSTRKFLNKPIPKEDLDLLIQAALHAPSGMGKQTWQFTVVKNRAKIQELAAAIAVVLGNWIRVDQPAPGDLRGSADPRNFNRLWDSGKPCGLRPGRPGVSGRCQVP